MKDDTLTGDLSSVDIATKENLQNLVEVGEKLLKKPVCKINMQTGVFESLNKGTNEEALKRYRQPPFLFNQKILTERFHY